MDQSIVRIQRKNINMRIFLVGMMAAGKTTLGKLLADKLGIPFFDLDDEVEKKAGRSINDIFEKEGEAAFREIESSTLNDILEKFEGDFVLAAGGGTPVFHDGMAKMKNAGLVVFLEADVELLIDRLYHDRNNRPLISSLENNMRSILTNILAYRNNTYQESNLIVDASLTPDEIADQIIAALRDMSSSR